MTARPQPDVVHGGDLLASTDGVANAVVCQASPIGEVTSSGLAPERNSLALGVLSNVIAVARRQAKNP